VVGKNSNVGNFSPKGDGEKDRVKSGYPSKTKNARGGLKREPKN